MVRINKIIHDSIVDGPGIRSVIFTQGCYHQCEGCHNLSLAIPDGGIEMTIEQIVDEIAINNFTKKVTLSGGDPLIQANIVSLAKALKEAGYHVMLYTGFTMDEIKKSTNKDILNYIDILVDGKFELDKRDISLKFRGSSNQNLYYFD